MEEVKSSVIRTFASRVVLYYTSSTIILYTSYNYVIRVVVITMRIRLQQQYSSNIQFRCKSGERDSRSKQVLFVQEDRLGAKELSYAVH